jgi:hypothetical protein
VKERHPHVPPQAIEIARQRFHLSFPANQTAKSKKSKTAADAGSRGKKGMISSARNLARR